MGHTPGPWVVGGASGNEGEAREIAASGRGIAWTASSWDDDAGCDVVTEEDEANAHLIAAAPELLAALKKAESLLSYAFQGGGIYGCNADEWLDMRPSVIAAINKAEGRSE